VDFVPPVATSLLLLPSLLLAVARISADFEFTILAGVLTFYKKLNVSDNGYLSLSDHFHFCFVSGLLDYQIGN
jgi:hypothetical protein